MLRRRRGIAQPETGHWPDRLRNLIPFLLSNKTIAPLYCACRTESLESFVFRLILPVALLSLTACADLPSSSPPPAKPASPTAWLKPLTREIPDSPPPVNPQVLRSIEQLGMPAPLRTLSDLELEGALSNKRENWQ